MNVSAKTQDKKKTQNDSGPRMLEKKPRFGGKIKTYLEIAEGQDECAQNFKMWENQLRQYIREKEEMMAEPNFHKKYTVKLFVEQLEVFKRMANSYASTAARHKNLAEQIRTLSFARKTTPHSTILSKEENKVPDNDETVNQRMAHRKTTFETFQLMDMEKRQEEAK